MNNAKYSLVLGACVTALVVWDCSPAQEATRKDVNRPLGFEPLPDAGADAGSPRDVRP